jgi:glucose/arabinose dehydrogenase
MVSSRALMTRALAALALGALPVGVAACGDDTPEAADTGASDVASSATATTEADGATSAAAGDETTPEGADLTRAEASDAPKPGQEKVIAKGLEVPWDIAFLPNRDALVSERESGKILRIPADGSSPKTVMTVPGGAAEGEGGLLGLAVSPSYAKDHKVYAYFTASADNRVAAVNLESQKVTPILTGIKKGQIHNGGALAFGPDGKLYVGVGETGDRGLAQDKSALNGKILRITASGKVPSDNPFKGSPVWTWGHRNVQGFAWDRAGRMWASEFGQDTTDEVNLIRKGRNYGWPNVEGKGDTAGGKYTNPLVTWSPTSTSSPSGAAIVGSTLYVGALAGQKLWKIPLHGAKAGKPVALVSEQYGRIRAVTATPAGRSLWFSTSNRDGRGSPADDDDRIVQLGV